MNKMVATLLYFLWMIGCPFFFKVTKKDFWKIKYCIIYLVILWVLAGIVVSLKM